MHPAKTPETYGPQTPIGRAALIRGIKPYFNPNDEGDQDLKRNARRILGNPGSAHGGQFFDPDTVTDPHGVLGGPHNVEIEQPGRFDLSPTQGQDRGMERNPRGHGFDHNVYGGHKNRTWQDRPFGIKDTAPTQRIITRIIVI